MLGQRDRSLSSVSLQKDSVDLLERQSPCLDHGEPHHKDTDKVEDGEDDVCLPTQLEQSRGQSESVEFKGLGPR